MKQQYICDIYINQMKVYIPKREEYIIPDECLIGEFGKYDSDVDIIDEEIIMEKKSERENLLKKKREQLEKYKIKR